MNMSQQIKETWFLVKWCLGLAWLKDTWENYFFQFQKILT